MRFEEKRPVRKKAAVRMRRRKRSLPFRLVLFLLRLCLIAVIACVVLWALPVGLFMTEGDRDLKPNAGLGSDTFNLLLLGTDLVRYGNSRTDTVIVASVGSGDVKLTSIVRDTGVEIEDHGTKRINAAYAYGGADCTIRTLNENFGMNLTDYVAVDFFSLADLVNAIGGVDLRITEPEQDQINRNLRNSWKWFDALGHSADETSLLSEDFSRADAEGYLSVHLDGFQALSYARIRKLDSDYMRSARQRRLINAAVRRVKQNWYDIAMYGRVIRVLKTATSLGENSPGHIGTSLNTVEMCSLGLKVLIAGTGEESLRLPKNGTYTDKGGMLKDVDRAANHRAWKEFVYGE